MAPKTKEPAPEPSDPERKPKTPPRKRKPKTPPAGGPQAQDAPVSVQQRRRASGRGGRGR
jgi:hypothetical protein